MLHLADEVRWADEVDVEVGASAWHLDEGYVFAVETDAGEPAGFVFVGDGTAEARFAAHGEAVAFAAALAAGSSRDEDLAVARRALDEHRYRGPFDTALVLGGDPAPAAFVRDLPIVSESKGGVVYVDAPPERYDVFVTAHRLGPARTRAEATLARRVERLAFAGVDPRVAMALDRADPGRSRWLAEVHGDQRWLPLLGPASQSLQDEWLSFAHDPTHAIDDRYVDTVFVHGLLDRTDRDPEPRFRVVTGVSPEPEPALGARIASAAVNVRAAPTLNGGVLGMQAEARLALVTDAPTRVVTLALPREHDPGTAEGRLPLGSNAKITSITTADGQPLTSLGAAFGPWHPGQDWLVDTWLLPEPLAPGEALTVDVRWTDRWPASHTLLVHPWALAMLTRANACSDCTCALQGLPAIVDLGQVAESRAVVPRSWVGPAQFPVDLRVVAPPGWAVAAPGVTDRDRPAGDGLLTRATTTGTARVSVARGAVDRAEPVGPFPGVRVLRGGLSADRGYAPLVRAVLNFYRPALPPFPDREIAIVLGPQAPRLSTATLQAKGCHLEATAPSEMAFQNIAVADPAPDRSGRAPAERERVWIGAGPGEIVVAGLREFGNEVGGVQAEARSRWPELVERGVAEALAAQWFNRLELGRRDGWIGPAAAAWLRDRFVASALSPEEAARWGDQAREDLEIAAGVRRSSTLPLTEPQPYRAEAGAEVLRALAAQIGERDVLRGLEAFLRGEVHTTEALEQAMSGAAGRDVSPFFDLWVRAGVRPAITGTWEVADGGVRLALASDVPIGRLEVPVGVTTRSGIRRSVAVLVDGRGEVTLSVRGVPLRVEVDPDGVLPLRSRSLTRGGAGGEGAGGTAPAQQVVARRE
jgi:hypothetical protein